MDETDTFIRNYSAKDREKKIFLFSPVTNCIVSRLEKAWSIPSSSFLKETVLLCLVNLTAAHVRWPWNPWNPGK